MVIYLDKKGRETCVVFLPYVINAAATSLPLNFAPEYPCYHTEFARERANVAWCRHSVSGKRIMLVQLLAFR